MPRTIVATVAPEVAELVVDRMWQWGVQAVSESVRPDGRIEVVTSVGDDAEAIERAVNSLDENWHVDVVDVDDSIALVSPEFLTPTWYAPDMVSVPSSLVPFEPESIDAVVTVIDPGSAFGLGDHPTTRTSMALLARTLRTPDRSIDSVLDVGCGTGALAILAAQLDVGIVRAIDIADAAVTATERNAELNGVAGSIDVDTTPLHAIRGAYDVVVANILAPVLIDLADNLRRTLAPGGSLIISGILADRHDHVLDALAPLRPVDSLEADGWISIILR
jgi:ribosomal protein L11 methyltransferase